MNNCSGRRGFLSLTACDAPGARNCAVCARMMCPDHLSPASGFVKCLECANSRQREPLPQKPVINDADSSYRYRESYYADRGYAPMATAFALRDSRSFDRTRMPDSLDDDADSQPGFGDS